MKNIDPKDLQLSFWGGDATLKNLELRCDILEKEMSDFPLIITSGKVQELIIHVPWTTIGSEPVEITIAGIDCSAILRGSEADKKHKLSVEQERSDVPANQTEDPSPVQSASYLQGLLNRIVNNVVFHIKNFTIRVTDIDIRLTFHARGMDVFTTEEGWNRKYVYTDYLKENYTIHKECVVTDMYATLEQLNGAGQVEYYEDPFTSNFAMIVRIMSTFKDNALREKRIEFWCTSIDFSTTPLQFSLCVTLLDRLLAMYYSSKEHRKAGEETTQESGQMAEEQKISDPSLSSSDNQTEKEDPKHVSADAPLSWSSWAWSFVVDPGDSSQEPTKEELEEVSSLGVKPGEKGICNCQCLYLIVPFLTML